MYRIRNLDVSLFRFVSFCFLFSMYILIYSSEHILYALKYGGNCFFVKTRKLNLAKREIKIITIAVQS